ncbi:hypothetical protein GGI43DRAFT_155863 [Trichoderma evansii]
MRASMSPSEKRGGRSREAKSSSFVFSCLSPSRPNSLVLQLRPPACGQLQLDQHSIRPRLLVLVLAVLGLASGPWHAAAVPKSNQARHRGTLPGMPGLIQPNPIDGWASAMARGCWANFPAAAVDAGLEKQKKQRFVARSRRCHQERCVALAHAYAGRTGAQRPVENV